MLFVEPAGEGRGLGTVLLRAAEARGASVLECFEANHRARAFYAARGWVEDGRYQRPFLGNGCGFVRFAVVGKQAG